MDRWSVWVLTANPDGVDGADSAGFLTANPDGADDADGADARSRLQDNDTELLT